MQNFHGYVLTNGLFTSIGSEEGPCPDPQRAGQRGASGAGGGAERALAPYCPGKVDLEGAYRELDRIRPCPMPQPPAGTGLRVRQRLLLILFGGAWQDGLAALAVGLGPQAVLLGLGRWGPTSCSQSFWARRLCRWRPCCCSAWGFGCNMDKAIIGALMPLVPGMALTMGIRDLLDADFLSGVIRMLDAAHRRLHCLRRGPCAAGGGQPAGRGSCDAA